MWYIISSTHPPSLPPSHPLNDTKTPTHPSLPFFGDNPTNRLSLHERRHGAGGARLPALRARERHGAPGVDAGKQQGLQGLCILCIYVMIIMIRTMRVRIINHNHHNYDYDHIYLLFQQHRLEPLNQNFTIRSSTPTSTIIRCRRALRTRCKPPWQCSPCPSPWPRGGS